MYKKILWSFLFFLLATTISCRTSKKATTAQTDKMQKEAFLKVIAEEKFGMETNYELFPNEDSSLFLMLFNGDFEGNTKTSNAKIKSPEQERKQVHYLVIEPKDQKILMDEKGEVKVSWTDKKTIRVDAIDPKRSLHQSSQRRSVLIDVYSKKEKEITDHRP